MWTFNAVTNGAKYGDKEKRLKVYTAAPQTNRKRMLNYRKPDSLTESGFLNVSLAGTDLRGSGGVVEFVQLLKLQPPGPFYAH